MVNIKDIIGKFFILNALVFLRGNHYIKENLIFTWENIILKHLLKCYFSKILYELI